MTVRDLLQHTPGLRNPDDTPAPSPNEPPSFYSRKGPGVGGDVDVLGYYASTVKAQPGAGFSYDNCDDSVAGTIVAVRLLQFFLVNLMVGAL